MVNVKIDPNDKDKIAIVYGDENISSVNGSNQSPNLNDIKKYQEILMKQDAENQKILASGEPAQATILSYKELNIKVNGNNPAVELLVEVHRTTGPKFLAIAKGIVLEQSVWKYQPGKNVYVKFNPNDLTQVSIDHS
jgi:hypothetical protein